MIDVIPHEVMGLIREAEDLVKAERGAEEEKRLAARMAADEESRMVKQVFLDALPEEIRRYADFSQRGSFINRMLDENEFTVDIKVLGLFPLRACLFRDIKDGWMVDLYQVSKWTNLGGYPTFDVNSEEKDFRKALLLAKKGVDEARQRGWLKETVI